ncbi:MAG: PilZ domain-containing protein [Candidatus Methylomirabilales bacterium]
MAKNAMAKKKKKRKEHLPSAVAEVKAEVTKADEASRRHRDVEAEEAAPDQRRYARFAVEGRTKGQVDASCDALILNISLGGALIEHSHVVRPGTISTLDLDFGGDTLRLDCRVVRSVVHREEVLPYGGRDLVYHTGLAFIDVTDETRQRIGDYIHSILEQGKATPTDGDSTHRSPTDGDRAISLKETYGDHDGSSRPVKYEVVIRLDNGDHIEGRFADKDNAVQFLYTYRPPRLKPGQ